MTTASIVSKLKLHQNIFIGHLAGVNRDEFLWRPYPQHWCLLEIVCHLYDEEREDFRARLKHFLNNPETTPPPIDPEGWVKERKYIARDFPLMVSKFIRERKESIKWLQSLEDVDWSRGFDHPKFGRMDAHFILNNWLAHDLLHIRQITRVKYLYLKEYSIPQIDYAGNW